MEWRGANISYHWWFVMNSQNIPREGIGLSKNVLFSKKALFSQMYLVFTLRYST